VQSFGLKRKAACTIGEPDAPRSPVDRSDHPIQAKALRSVLFVEKPTTEAALSRGVQALGFVVTTTVAGDKTQRMIEPR
jgi:hypothetical protein